MTIEVRPTEDGRVIVIFPSASARESFQQKYSRFLGVPPVTVGQPETAFAIADSDER